MNNRFVQITALSVKISRINSRCVIGLRPAVIRPRGQRNRPTVSVAPRYLAPGTINRRWGEQWRWHW